MPTTIVSRIITYYAPSQREQNYRSTKKKKQALLAEFNSGAKTAGVDRHGVLQKMQNGKLVKVKNL